MKLTKERKILLEALITLQLINYMVGTIILKDFFLVKYLRDAIVVVLLFEIARDRRKKMQFGTITICFLVFVFCETFWYDTRRVFAYCIIGGKKICNSVGSAVYCWPN